MDGAEREGILRIAARAVNLHSDLEYILDPPVNITG